MTRHPMLNTRAEPELHERVQRAADRRYGGNKSLLVRDAVVRLLDELDGSEQRRIEEAAMRLIEAQMGIRLVLAS